MKYIPLAETDRLEMLAAIGVKSIDELFSSVPAHLKLKQNLDYPPAQSEMELRKSFDGLARLSPQPNLSFSGCGIYQHDVPSMVPYVQSRSEFATSYTPYQPEISQGTLQCIFEFQTLACQLTEMELSNASLYDGATALGEAGLMALRLHKKPEGRILLSSALHPHYHDVFLTYCELFKDRIETLPLKDGRMDLGRLEKELSKGDVSVLVTQSPNIFGCIEDEAQIGKLLSAHKTYWITSTMEPLVWGVLRGPGAFGAHIVTAEGQSFGNGPYLGGSSYGIFCTRNEYLRQLPGRLVGESIDEDGRRSYTLTFATREQFIRRGRATSNICTNNNLNMLAGLFHLCILGKSGIRQLAIQNYSKAHFAHQELSNISGIELSAGPFFNEFCLEFKSRDASEVLNRAAEENWVCGVDLGRFKEEWKRKLLLHVSELHSREQINSLVSFLKKAA